MFVLKHMIHGQRKRDAFKTLTPIQAPTVGRRALQFVVKKNAPTENNVKACMGSNCTAKMSAGGAVVHPVSISNSYALLI